jgi:nitroreductase
METTDLINAILRRKSTRRFKEHPILKEDLLTLLECARWAPSGKNVQPWEFIVVDDKAVITTIYNYGCHIAYADKQDRYLDQNPCRFDEASALLFILGGASAYAAQNIALAAYALGYGSCILGAFDRSRTALLLGVPEDKRLELCVAIGIADKPRSDAVTDEMYREGVLPYAADTRKPLHEIAFYRRYGVGITGEPKRRTRSVRG